MGYRELIPRRDSKSGGKIRFKEKTKKNRRDVIALDSNDRDAHYHYWENYETGKSGMHRKKH